MEREQAIKFMLDLLKLIPGIDIESLDRGCTGMAGTFGIAAEHFEQSVQIGDPLIRTLQTNSI